MMNKVVVFSGNSVAVIECGDADEAEYHYNTALCERRTIAVFLYTDGAYQNDYHRERDNDA